MACPPSDTRQRCRTGASTGALAIHPVRRFAQHSGLEREPVGPAPIVRRSTQVSSSRASAATCAAGVPAVSPGVHHSKPPAERNRDRCCTQPGAHWLSPIPPACVEKMQSSSSSAARASSSAHPNMISRWHIGGDGPPELVERQTGVLAEPARYEPVEDKGWLATGRGTEVQELGAERRSEVRQPGDAVVAQARIPIDRPPFNSCAGGGLKSASAFGTASSTRRTRNGPYPTRPYPQAPKAGCPRTSTTPAWTAPCPRAPTPT